MNAVDEIAKAPSGPYVGERLRAAREAKGMSLEEVALATRIPRRHLHTIERGDYEGLPAPTYSAGFIKTWARVLGLDEQALAAEFRAELGGATVQNAPSLPYEPADPRRTPPVGLSLLALACAVILTLGYLYWRGTQDQPPPVITASAGEPAPQAPPAPPAASPVPSPNPAAQATRPIVISTTQDVWIKISDQGKTLFMNVLKPGERFEIPADAVAPLMTTGRPGSTHILVGQSQIPAVGDPDRIAKDISLKPADLLGRIGAAPPPPAAPVPAATEASPAG